jgi:hypothetical protein
MLNMITLGDLVNWIRTVGFSDCSCHASWWAHQDYHHFVDMLVFMPPLKGRRHYMLLEGFHRVRMTTHTQC